MKAQNQSLQYLSASAKLTKIGYPTKAQISRGNH